MTDLRAAVEAMLKVAENASAASVTEREYTRADRFDGAAAVLYDVLDLIPEGAVLVTEQGLRAALDDLDEWPNDTDPPIVAVPRIAAAILRHLRGTP